MPFVFWGVCFLHQLNRYCNVICIYLFIGIYLLLSLYKGKISWRHCVVLYPWIPNPPGPTHRYSSTRVQVWTRSPGRRVWRAGTSLRSAGVHQDRWDGCTPSVWSHASCAGRKCSPRGWPWTGCSAPCARGTGDPRSKDSRCPDSRWYSPPPCTLRAKTCKMQGEKGRLTSSRGMMNPETNTETRTDQSEKSEKAL